MLIKIAKTNQETISKIENYAKSVGLASNTFTGDNCYAIVIDGREQDFAININAISNMDGVEKILSADSLLSLRDFKKQNTSFKVGDVTFGTDDMVLMAGPCAIEDYESLDRVAKHLTNKGVKVLRGGAFKPRTSPYSFQGLGAPALQMAREICDKYGILFISEITDVRQLPLFMEYTDIIQVGARNSKNFAMLYELGKIDKPVLLKRGMSDTLDDFLMSADYVYSGGNSKIILCERGIKGYDLKHFRNVLDMNALLTLPILTHLPICFDPSHGSGRSDFIIPLSCAAKTLGATSLLIEVAEDPDCAICDGKQSISPNTFDELARLLPLYNKASPTMECSL